jgi:hypothetical protein
MLASMLTRKNHSQGPARGAAAFGRIPARLRAALLLLALGLIAYASWRLLAQRTRAWAVAEVPIAFWTWHSSAPAQADVQRAIDAAGARTLFIRAGQIDFDGNAVRRIRAVRGRFPVGVEIHLVYNATPDLLSQIERLDSAAFTSEVARSYEADAERARRDGAQVAGVQLDIDVPTRLLPKYEQFLGAMRERLPNWTILSITGLATWMNSPEAAGVVAAADFWVLQCYGATVPERLDRATPISSPQQVARAVDRARALGRPFYAGLAAYGYAIRYARNGEFIEMSGSLDPSLVAQSPDLELVERNPFAATPVSDGGAIASEQRLVYRAREDAAIGELGLRAGEWLVLDLPTAESLRASARAVRERAGDRLLGICVFRLPAEDDPTTLTIQEVQTALTDVAPTVAATVTIKPTVRNDASADDDSGVLAVTIANGGSASALVGGDAMIVELRVPAGSVRRVSLDGFASSKMLYERPGGKPAAGGEALQPCGPGRANVVRLEAPAWRPGDGPTAFLEMAGEMPQSISILITVRTDAGRVWRDERIVKVSAVP